MSGLIENCPGKILEQVWLETPVSMAVSVPRVHAVNSRQTRDAQFGCFRGRHLSEKVTGTREQIYTNTRGERADGTNELRLLGRKHELD